jgi:glycine/D-amino acid oxidase-like deaminating enzyme
MPGSPSVIVVGAGIVGAACAEALAAAGCEVEVVEASSAGTAGATSAGMGHLVLMDDSEAQRALTSYSRRLWAQRAAELPAEVEHRRCGTLWVAADETEMVHVRSKAASHAALGEVVQVLDARQLREAEPALRDGLAGALLVADDCVLYPPAAARVLAERAVRLGARLRTGARVEAVAPGRARWDGRWREGDHVLVAAGAESVSLLPELPIVPRKGHLVVSDRHPGLLRHQVVELGYLRSAGELTNESVAFNVQPRATGQLLIGSSRELVGWDASLNRRLLARMLRRAMEYMPVLAGVEAVRTWTGFRPATPDKQPLIGAWEPRLWVAAGHEGLGITTALGTAQLACSLLLRRTPPLDPAPFAPRRPMRRPS